MLKGRTYFYAEVVNDKTMFDLVHVKGILVFEKDENTQKMRHQKVDSYKVQLKHQK